MGKEAFDGIAFAGSAAWHNRLFVNLVGLFSHHSWLGFESELLEKQCCDRIVVDADDLGRVC